MRILLNYSRNDTTFDGTITISSDDDVTRVRPFASKTFAQMMREVHLALMEYPNYELVFSRGESRHFREYVIEEPLRVLLRDDPVAAIRELSPANVTVDMRTRRKKAAEEFSDRVTIESPAPSSTVPSGLSPLPAGHDTIAESFGDEVYLRTRGDLVECPCCGRWQGTLRAYPTAVDMYCPCQFLVPGKVVTREGSARGWFAVRTQTLLSSNRERYFLPRAWNPNGGWIKHEDLLVLFTSYMKEKMECSAATTVA